MGIDDGAQGTGAQGTDGPSAALVELAGAYGISSSYWSFYGEHVQVSAPTLLALLRAMGVDVDTVQADTVQTDTVQADTESRIQAALLARQEAPWRELVPPSLVVSQGAGELVVQVVEGHDPRLTLCLEDGTVRDLGIPDQHTETRVVDGRVVHRLRVPVPSDLPLGWHTIHAVEHPHGAETHTRSAECSLVVTPARLVAPPSRPGNRGRAWGLMTQLYSVRSRASWGIGDFADLADLAAIVGERGADFVLINPIHAAEVAAPIEPSPYLPASRRFIAPLYVRPEDVREAAYLTADQRTVLDRARRPVAARNTEPDDIDRDAAWEAKKAALEVVFAAPRSIGRQRSLEAFVRGEGQALADFALWCALEEHFAEEPAAGGERPAEAADIDSPLVGRLREQLADRVAFYSWLQWIADEQIRTAQAAALRSGMRIGIMHDLAVGVHSHGSDVWSRSRIYAPGVWVGAPPDMYNQQGQNWHQPPWLPDELARSGYAPLRDLLRGLLRHAGALRIDHIIGMFRLWWIPAELGAGAGTYVRYDHEAMIGVLALEAQRAGAVVIGEDLGNVEPWVRDYLSSRGILGTSVMWFENDESGPRPPEHYRQAVLATVTTHDLPPTAGYLAGEHVELRARLGLLEQSVEHEREAARRERDTVLSVLRERGLIAEDATEEQIIAALHVYIAASPSQLLGVSLVDAVGERRAQNQPGTYREYPNWRVPLAGPDGKAVLLDDLAEDERFRLLASAVDRALHA
jgi:4-alpha-glucanotransferase